jgi:tripartite-type tricarboxylate transporter receptor subunit TctC
MSFNVTRRHLLATGVAAATLPLLDSQPKAQAGWPNKPIRIIVPFPVGGQTDLIARAYGDYIGKQLGQPVIVENKAGAGGTVGAFEVKRAAPDGYTLMLTIGSTLIANRVMIRNLPYDPDKDFTLIAAIVGEGVPLVASAKCGATNLKEFIDYAKKTDKVSLGSYAAGSTAHMTIVEINRQYGTNIEPVHYRGEAPMWADVMSQSIDGAIGSYTAALPVVQAGRGKVIGAVNRPIRAMPNLPTLQQQGAISKLFDLTGFSGLLAAPTGTPIEIVRKLSELMVAAGKDERTRAALANFAIEPPIGYEAAQKIYKEEAPITIQFLSSLNLTAE